MGAEHEAADDVFVGVLRQCGRFLDRDLGPVGVQLLGEHHGEAGLRALADVAMRHQHGNTVIRGDFQPGVEVGAVALDGEAVGGEGHAQHEAAADETTGGEEAASRVGAELTHAHPPRHGWRGGCGGRCRSGRYW